MRLIVDTEARVLIRESDTESIRLPLHSPEAFTQLGHLWLTVGWGQRYTYGFTWLGRPIIQLPEDVLRIQELIWSLKPDVILETGVAHGGSLILYASLCQLMGRGRVVGIDVEIRPANRKAIEEHPLFDRITLVEGDAIAPATIERVRDLVAPGETVLVLLDSCHSKAHVLAEIEAYAPLVTVGSYVVAMDGIMADVADVPGGKPDWTWNNPLEAVRTFVAGHPEFEVAAPPQPFDETMGGQPLTYWPGGYLRRVK